MNKYHFDFSIHLHDCVPLEADDPLDGTDDGADLVHDLHVDGELGVEHRDQQDVVGRQLLVLALQELPQVGVVIVPGPVTPAPSLLLSPQTPHRTYPPVH